MGGVKRNLKLMMKCSFALHRQRACVAGKWPQTVEERLIHETARSCAPALVTSGL